MAFNPDEYLATKSSSFDPDEYLKSKTQEPTEKGGFFGSYKQSLKERVNTAAPAAQLYFGAGDQRAATDELLKFKDDAASVYKQTEFGDLGKAFKEGRYGDALGGTLDKFKEVAGSSLGSQTPAIAAGLGTRLAVGAGAAALGVAAAPAALLGTAAWGLTTLGSYIADNLARQKEEQDKKGTKYQDVNRLSATAAATGQTALDAFGFSYFKPLGRLVGFSGKESAEKATMEIVQAATNPNAYKKAVASGAAKGIAFEVPQEVTQSVLERWQAGLALNPFTDPEAAKEYLEAAGGALLLGGPMGAYSGAVNTYRARQTPEAEVMLRDSKSGAAQDIEGEGNVNQSIGQTGGTGTQVPGERGAGTATGTNIAESGGVDAAGQTPAGPAGGTAVQPGALNEPPGLMDGLPGDGTPADTLPNLAPQNVDEFAANAQQGIPGSTDTVSAKYGNETFAGSNALIEPPGLMDAPADTEEVSSAPGAPITQAVQDPDSLARLRDNYVALKDELTPILGRGDTRKADALVRDLQRMVDESAGLIGDPELIKNLKNPMFDGKSPLDNLAQDAAVASEPRAMQSNMFGKFINGAHNAQLALAHTGTTQGAIKFLQDKRRRLQNDLDTGKLDAAWAQKIGARFGMNQGESVKNYQQVAELYTQAAIAEVDAALNQLSEKKSTPKAMQSDMFGEKQKAPTVQAPDLVNNGRTLDLVIDGKVIKTYDLVSQGLWDAFKGRPEAQENLLQSAAAKKVKDEANEALKDADRIYSEQAPLSRVENDAIQALANNDTSLMKRIVTNLTIRDSVLRMLSSALSYPGKPYRDFSGLEAMSEYDPRAAYTAQNILRYAPKYMLEGAAIPEKFKSTPKAMQSDMFGEGQSKDEAVKPIEQTAETTDMFGLTANEKAELEARVKSAAIEQRNKNQPQVVGASISPQQRLDILVARETDLANQVEKAKTTKIGSSAGADETVVFRDLQKELALVRKDVARARIELAMGKEAPAVQPTKVAEAPVKVESKQAQNEMFDEVGGTKKPRKEEPKKERKAPTSIAEDFEEFGAETAEDEKSETETQREAQEKEAEQKAAEAKQAEEDKNAPEVGTEHVQTTEEGKAIKSFFDAIKPAARPGSDEATKIADEKRKIVELLTEFDITKPGERTSAGIKAAYKFFTDLMGGEAKFETLLKLLQTPGTMTQAQALGQANLPNLTTRRGLETLKGQVQAYINSLGAKGPRIKIEPGKVAYEGEVSTDAKRAMTPGTTPEGKIRRPSMEVGTKQFKISDTKLRSAWTKLKQMFDSGGNVTPEMLAAKAYITNPTRSKFGYALADLAQDLALYDMYLEAKYGMRAADVKELTAEERQKLPQTVEQKKVKSDGVGANATFYGEGGIYAERFQRWIEQNLDPKTIATLNQMVENERANIEEEFKFNKAVTIFNLEVQKRKTASAQSRIAAAEKATGQKIKLVAKEEKKKKAREALEAVEGIETEGDEKIEDAPIEFINRPEKQKLHAAVVRTLQDGDLKGALKILANEKGNGYFKNLAARLLEAGLTAKSRVLPQNTIESLGNDPKIKETLDNQLRALRDMVETSLPEAQRGEILDALSSKNLFSVNAGVVELKDVLTNEAQLEIVNETQKLLDKQFNWDAKYDPDTDTLTMRGGMMDNNVLFHEALHAATIHLIDNPDKLSGARKEAYNRLLELYNYSKGTLANEHLGSYGLKDLHEFVSEAMSNPDFQALLRAMRYKSAPFSLWNEFTTAITKLFKTPSKEESDVMVEVMRATNILMAGPMDVEGMTVKSTPKAMARIALKAVPAGMTQPTPTTMRRLMTPTEWNEIKRDMPYILSTATSATRPQLLGALTLRQIDDLTRGRIPQVGNFIRVVERFLARKNNILRESGEISQRWEEMQRKNPEMSRLLAKVMHAATIKQFDPDPTTWGDKDITFATASGKIITKPGNNYTAGQKAENQDITDMWAKLTPEAKGIYKGVRKFYESRYSEYKDVLDKRIADMKAIGVTDKKINDIKKEFEKTRQRGPYFPLMRHGRFLYQVGEGPTREYYMFETQGQKEKHLAQRIQKDPKLADSLKEGSTYKGQMDLHARQSQFLQNSFEAIDSATFKGSEEAIELQKQVLKDSIYQNYLSNQPEQSFRKAFMNRSNIAGYSEDALRNFARSSFHIGYQLSRFENSPDMFSNIQAARMQIKDRKDVDKSYSPKLIKENNELNDYVTEMESRLGLMLNPPDQFNLLGFITPSLLSNIGFIWYLTAPASAITNVLGGAIIGIPTLVGMNLRMNPGMSYAQATVNALWQTKKAATQIISTGLGNKKDGYFPSMGRFDGMTDAEKQAYDRFVGDGLIDITATYDQSGLASAPTGDQYGAAHKGMQLMTGLFHNAERFNREVMAMSAFRQAMDARKDRKDKDAAFEEAVLEAKDVTNRAMFDYSSANKPRFFQNPVASVVLQFKQFPQQMTFFLAHNALNMWKGESPEIRREARARFVGTMGMAGIFSGVTGIWGFSTVASIANAVFNGLSDEEEPFDFELEFINWAINTFGVNIGTMLTRGIGNAAGLDIASRTKLDSMWFRDSRKNQDEVEALQSFLVDMLGPTVGLTVTAARATQLWNEGHADRAIESLLPAFAKAPITAIRYGREGVNTLKGDPLMEDMGPFYLMMQSLGIRNAELAERQFYNIQIKGQEQAVMKERTNLLNLFALGFMSGDSEVADKALDKIFKFNDKHPSSSIPADTILKSIQNRMKKSAETDSGLYIDRKMRGVLGGTNYVNAISANNDDDDDED
jgi:hypothetical protein